MNGYLIANLKLLDSEAITIYYTTHTHTYKKERLNFFYFLKNLT
jgi:hypothetical protein